MDDVTSALRRWLTDLDEDALVAVSHWSAPLHRHLHRFGSSERAERRQLPKVRKEIRQSSDQRLAEIARASVRAARAKLLQQSYTADQMDAPSPDALRRMLCDLPPGLGPLALFGLLLGVGPAAEIARERAEEFQQILGLKACTSPGTEVTTPALVPAPRKTPDDEHTRAAPTDAAVPEYAPQPEDRVSNGAHGVDVSDLRTLLDDARSRADEVAAALQSAAAALDAGRLPADARCTADALVELTGQIEDALAGVARIGADGTVPAGLDEAIAVVEEAERAAAERADAERRSAEQRAELEARVARAEEDAATAPEATRPLYESLLDGLRAQLAALDPPPEAADEADHGLEVAWSPPGEADAGVPRSEPVESVAGTAAEQPAEDEQPLGTAPTATVNDEPGTDVVTETTVHEPDVPEAYVPEVSVVSTPPGAPESVGADPTPAPAVGAQSPPQDPTLTDIGDPVADSDGSAVESDTEEQSAFPWEAGSPPAVERLVSDGRLAEAYWLTAASEEAAPRRDVLRFAYAAFAARNAAEAVHALNRWSVGAGDDREAMLVEAAALLRCGLETGWSHHYPQLESSGINLPKAWQELVTAASEAVQKQGRIDRGRGTDEVDLDAARVELGAAAERLAIELPARSNRYQRATVVQQALLRRENALGAMLGLIMAWSEGTAAIGELSPWLDELSGPQAVDRVIDDTDVATKGPAKERIIAGARQQLRATIGLVVDRAHEAVALADRMSARRQAGSPPMGRLREATAEALTTDQVNGVGGAALHLLARWIEQPDPPTRHLAAEPPAAGGVPTDALLLLPDLPRDEDRNPVPTHRDSRTELLRLIDDPSPGRAIERYCETGALDLADRLARLRPDACPPATLDAAEERWQATTTELRDKAEKSLDRLRSQDAFASSKSGRDAAIAGRLDAVPPARRRPYDRITAELTAIREELRAEMDARTAQLRTQTRDEVVDVELRERIEMLLDEDDTVTAHEFLALYRKGQRIPPPRTDLLADVRAFLTVLGGENAGSDDIRDWAAAFRVADERPTEAAKEAMAQWSKLAHARDGQLQQAVLSVLRLIGLPPKAGTIRGLRGDRAQVRGFEVAATPRETSYVPQLGSGARGRYRVLVVRDDRRGRGLLDDLDPAGTDVPYVMLYLRPMDPQMRAQLAADAWARRAQVLVVDPPVAGWLVAREYGSFRAAQRLTLPWSAFDPYQPYMAGLVASELFVGREDETRKIVDPSGGLFVYGGRQLGKSALLHRIEDTPGADRTAVYLDLKGLGIGEAQAPSRIWPELAAELTRRGVLSSKFSDRPDQDAVARAIGKWLDADATRQLLVLADEADAFLTADSHSVTTAGGVQHFPNMSRLKQLMESTRRRFKIVFAGLHQVQRFKHLPNVPTPHGGPDILIGPLEPVAARRLVVEPLAALGFTFERPELVWRLLAATNYQPAPIQIFCQELLARLRVAQDGPPIVPTTITADDVEQTAADRDVRARIADRMRITVNLEDRYRVLALLIARKSLDDDFACSYSPSELLDEAAAIWPEGFTEAFDEAELAVYLEEMEGLGLLARQPDGRTYAVRSPNVVSMLGTREDFDRELEGSDFDLAYEYNPRLSRRLLGQEPDGPEQRSPLSDAALKALVETARSGVVPLVAGSRALALDRVPGALVAYLEAEGETVVTCGPADLPGRLADHARRPGTWLALDLRNADEDTAQDAVRLAVASTTPVVALVDKHGAERLSGERTTVVRLARWSAESLRSWPECPFNTPELRRRLIAATGGWPRIVEGAIDGAVRSGTEVALSRADQVRTDPDLVRQILADAEVDADVTAVLQTWTGAANPGEVLPHEDLAVVLDTGASEELEARLRTLGLLTDHPEGVSLDAFTHRCLLVCDPAR